MHPFLTSAVLIALAATPMRAQAIVRDSLSSPRLAWELVRVPAGDVTIPGANGPLRKQVPAFELLRTEVPWELYDVFYLRLDVPRDERTRVDAAARPSRPYGAPDRGFGHRGWPAISLTHGAAMRFAVWLSERPATLRRGDRRAVAARGRPRLRRLKRLRCVTWPGMPPTPTAPRTHRHDGHPINLVCTTCSATPASG
jgi:hypothetical protein